MSSSPNSTIYFLPQAQYCNISAGNISACQYNFNMGICESGAYNGWMDMIYCIDPNFWAFMGLSIVLGASIAGAAW